LGCQNNTTFRKDDVSKLADQKSASRTTEDWQRRREHVRKIEQQLMAREGLLEAGREFVFHVSGDSDDNSDESSDSSRSDEEGQACGDDICADIAGLASLQYTCVICK
jgi:hypothetical protein